MIQSNLPLLGFVEIEMFATFYTFKAKLHIYCSDSPFVAIYVLLFLPLVVDY